MLPEFLTHINLIKKKWFFLFFKKKQLPSNDIFEKLLETRVKDSFTFIDPKLEKFELIFTLYDCRYRLYMHRNITLKMNKNNK